MFLYPGHTAVESLHLSTDRAIDPQLLKAAQAYDAANRRPPVTAAAKTGRITLKPAFIVAIMAAEIIRIGASQGCITVDDFRRLGLTDQQIELHKADAFTQAIAQKPGVLTFVEAVAS